MWPWIVKLKFDDVISSWMKYLFTGCMARRKKAANIEISDLECIIMSYFFVQCANSIITAVDNQWWPKGFYKFLITTRMIPMMVCRQHRFQLNILILYSFKNSFGVHRIHDSSFFRLVADDQVHVVVGKSRKNFYAHVCHSYCLLRAVTTSESVSFPRTICNKILFHFYIHIE